jgi:hypothetical protein
MLSKAFQPLTPNSLFFCEIEALLPGFPQRSFAFIDIQASFLRFGEVEKSTRRQKAALGLPSALRPRAFWRRAEAFAQAGRRAKVGGREVTATFWGPEPEVR